MTTKGDLVEAIYEEIALAGYVFDLTPEERITALRRIDRMAARWDSAGIRIGYNLPSASGSGDLDEDAGIPDWAEDAFITNGAIRVATTLGKQVSAETRQAARESYRTLLMGNYEIPQMQHQRQMPVGSGNRRNVKTQTFFAPIDRITTTHDAFLEPSGKPFPDDN